jgi:hypothetical protein
MTIIVKLFIRSVFKKKFTPVTLNTIDSVFYMPCNLSFPFCGEQSEVVLQVTLLYFTLLFWPLRFMDSMAFIYVPFPRIDQLQHVAFREEKDPFVVGGGECNIYSFTMTKTFSMVSHKIITSM